MNVQFKKGVLELLVLALLHRHDCYGYELVESISQHIELSEGTIYPLLKRLRDENYVSTYLAETSNGPPRKYYRLEERGRTVYEEQRQEWLNFSQAVNALLTER